MITEELQKLLALQAVDTALDGCARREADAHARLSASHATIEQFRQQIKDEKRFLDDALKEHKTLEIDIKGREEQVKKYTAQMYDVKTNKEYTTLKDEIEKAKGENMKQEERLLQIMIREDELKGAAGRRAQDLAVVDAEVKKTEAEVKATLEACAAEKADLEAKRAEARGAMGAGLIRRYERIREARGGSPVARIVAAPGGKEVVCSECHITIRPQIIVEVHKQGDLVSCESCGRILYIEDAESSEVPQPTATQPG
ncbi:MAG: C4-type zinc ribbon domain-containing protein [Candidatus Coatesbacteria bacterium]